MNILITAATVLEIQQIENFLSSNATKTGLYKYSYRDHTISTQVTGVGSVHVAFSIARYPNIESMDIIINIGIAGSFDRSIGLGDVVIVESDCFADLGIDQADGNFQHLWQSDLAPKHFPYNTDGWLKAHLPNHNLGLPLVKSITVNSATGTNDRAHLLSDTYEAHIETMESAAFIYACKMLQIKHLPLRSISNYVEQRDKSTWQVQLALDNISQTVISYLGYL